MHQTLSPMNAFVIANNKSCTELNLIFTSQLTYYLNFTTQLTFQRVIFADCGPIFADLRTSTGRPTPHTSHLATAPTVGKHYDWSKGKYLRKIKVRIR